MNDANKATALSGMIILVGLVLFWIIGGIQFNIVSPYNVIVGAMFFLAYVAIGIFNPRARHYHRALSEWEKTYRYEKGAEN